MALSLSQLPAIVNGVWLQSRQPSAQITHLLLDSRVSGAPAGAVFFALPGRRHDGHDFIADVYKAGVRHFVVSKPVSTEQIPEADVLLASDVWLALQQTAAAHREQFAFPVIGITGSNGKTVVKEWLYQALRADFNIVRSPKSYNSQTGVPLSVWQMQAWHTLGIFEAGISQSGEMARLASVIRPDIGIFTNIGPAHREGFPSKAAKVAEKMLLFENCRLLIYGCDDEWVDEAARRWAGQKADRRAVSWSKEGKNADVAARIAPNGAGARIDLCFLQAVRSAWSAIPEGFTAAFDIPFSDAASVENAVHVWLTAVLLGVPASALEERMRGLEAVEMRLELKAGINGCTLVNDFYNNDSASLRIALQFAKGQSRNGRLTLILSDILQSGPEERLYEKVAALLVEQQFTRLIGIGRAVALLQHKLPTGFDAAFYEDTDALLADWDALRFQDELIVLKGARPFAFERIARRLEQKAHKTVLEVNLSAMIHNLNVYNRLLKPGAKMMAMVKATAYGSGSAEVAKMLEFHKVDYLGVAYADEGVELRRAGVRLPILVLNPEASGFDTMLRYDLEPEVYSRAELESLADFVGAQPLRIHLKLDTGMHRLGFVADDMPWLIEYLRARPNLVVQTVFTHLAGSDAAQYDAFTHRQAATFSALYEAIADGLGYRPMRHIVNTGGIVRFPEYHFEMVRLGIGLYGIDTAGLQTPLQVVNTLKATISQIKELGAGETVGYNRNGQIRENSRIGTISIGYADGLLRLAGNGRFSVWVKGREAPTIGNVCMDMTMIDLTHIPEAAEGDEVIIFGEQQPVQKLANCLQTIPYEVFTTISERVKRVYYSEG